MTYTIAGMTCGGCVSSVTKALQAQLPEAKVTVTLETQTVEVEGEHTEAQVREAVEDAGFDWVSASGA